MPLTPEQQARLKQLQARMTQLQARRKAMARPFQKPPAPKPGDSPDNPAEVDLWKNNTARYAASFGNVQGLKDELAALGYSNARENAAGDLVVQDAQGKWVKDEIGVTTPVRAAAAYGGHSLKDIGMVGGGIAAGGPALPTGAGALLAAAGGGAAGRAAGEGLRQEMGRHYGTYEAPLGERAAALAKTALEGATMETGGRLIGGLPIPTVTRKGPGVRGLRPGVLRDEKGAYIPLERGLEAAAREVPQLTKEQLITASNILARGGGGRGVISKDSTRRIFERPGQVAEMLPVVKGLRTGTDEALYISRSGTKEALSNMARANEVMGAVRRKALDEHGEKLLGTNELVRMVREFIRENRTTPKGRGKVPLDELEALMKLAKEEFMLEAPIPPGAVLPKGQKVVPMEKASFENLLRVSDYLERNVIPKGAWKPGQELATREVSTPVQSFYKKLRRSIRSKLYDVAPEYGKIAGKYHQFRKDSELVRKLGETQSAESFIIQLGKGLARSEQRDALSRVAPETYQRVLDMQAAKEYTDAAAISWPWVTPIQSLRYALFGAQAGGYIQTNPTMVALTGLGVAATEPRLHRRALGMAGRLQTPWTGLMERGVAPVAPQVAPRAAAGFTMQGARPPSPWDIFRTEEEKKNARR